MTAIMVAAMISTVTAVMVAVMISIVRITMIPIMISPVMYHGCGLVHSTVHGPQRGSADGQSQGQDCHNYYLL